MHQPPVLPDVVGVGFADGEVEHLARLLNGSDVGDQSGGAVGLLDRIPDLEVSRAHPVPAQVAVAFRRGPGLGIGGLRDEEGMPWGRLDELQLVLALGAGTRRRTNRDAPRREVLTQRMRVPEGSISPAFSRKQQRDSFLIFLDLFLAASGCSRFTCGTVGDPYAIRRFLNHTGWNLRTPCHFLRQTAFQRFSDTWKHVPHRCKEPYLKSGIPEKLISGIPDFGYAADQASLSQPIGQLLPGDGWSPETAPQAFQRIPGGQGLRFQKRQQERIRRHHLHAVGFQVLAGKVLEVECDDHVRLRVNGRREDMPVIRVRQRQALDQGLVAGDLRVGNRLIHQGPDPLYSRRPEVRAVEQQVPAPLVMDGVGPAGSH